MVKRGGAIESRMNRRFAAQFRSAGGPRTGMGLA